MTPEERASDLMAKWQHDDRSVIERISAAVREAVLEERRACEVLCDAVFRSASDDGTEAWGALRCRDSIHRRARP